MSVQQEPEPETETETIERHGKKERRNISVTPEVIRALDHLGADDVQMSETIEQSLLSHLIDVYGKDAVIRVIEFEQARLEDDERLEEPKELSLPQ